MEPSWRKCYLFRRWSDPRFIAWVELLSYSSARSLFAKRLPSYISSQWQKEYLTQIAPFPNRGSNIQSLEMANGRNHLTGSDAEGIDGVPLKQLWNSYSIVRSFSNQGLDCNGLPGLPGNVGPRQSPAAELMLVLRKCLTQFCHKFCIPGSNLPRKGTRRKNKGQQQMGGSMLSNLFFVVWI